MVQRAWALLEVQSDGMTAYSQKSFQQNGLHRQSVATRYTALALSQGEALAERADAVGGGLEWKTPRIANRYELYRGAAGNIVFLFALYEATRQEFCASVALQGCRRMEEMVARTWGCGLICGIAGLGAACLSGLRATTASALHEHTDVVVRELVRRAIVTRDGPQWSDTEDLISGNIGTALFLLDAAQFAQWSGCGVMAFYAGRRSAKEAATGSVAPSGLGPSGTGLAHGPLGSALLSARLFRCTRDPWFYRRAVHVVDIEEATLALHLPDHSMLRTDYEPRVPVSDGTGLLAIRTELSWCRGLVGMANVYLSLYDATHESTWATRCANLTANLVDVALVHVEQGLSADPFGWASRCHGLAGLLELCAVVYETFGDYSLLTKAVQIGNRLAAMLESGAMRADAGWNDSPNGLGFGEVGLCFSLLHLATVLSGGGLSGLHGASVY